MAVRRRPPDLDDEYVTVPEAAGILHVSPSSIWRWIARGELTAYRVGRRFVRLKREDVTRMIRPIRARGESEGESSAPERQYLTLADPDDIWAGYDPEAVRQALRELQEAPVLTPDEADALIADLYRAREAGARPPTRP